jgi:K+ transporter
MHCRRSSIDGGVVSPNAHDVFGVISLVFWSITLIVSVKYVTFIMRADNDNGADSGGGGGGGGGVMALAALARKVVSSGNWAASFFPDSCLIAMSCCGLPVQVLGVDLVWGPVSEC